MLNIKKAGRNALIVSVVIGTAISLKPQVSFARDFSLSFDREGISTVESTAVVRGDRDDYYFTARPGQHISIAVAAVENNAVISLFYKQKGKWIYMPTTEQNARVLYSVLPNSENSQYRIEVSGTRGNATYDLFVGISTVALGDPDFLTDGQLSNYASEEFGLQFQYPSRYRSPTPSRGSTRSGEEYVSLYLLEYPDEPEPEYVAVEIYENPERLSLEAFRDRKISVNEMVENPNTTVAGETALDYEWWGMYEARDLIFSAPNGRYIVRISAMGFDWLAVQSIADSWQW